MWFVEAASSAPIHPLPNNSDTESRRIPITFVGLASGQTVTDKVVIESLTY